jgi:hypothetical protein
VARLTSKEKLGYLPIDRHHHEAILSLVTPATPVHRLLDPFAGEGEFLEVAANQWNVTPYANELDGDALPGASNASVRSKPSAVMSSG